MKHWYKLAALLFIVACTHAHKTVSPNAPVAEEMSAADFYLLQMNDREANSLTGSVVQLSGYFKYFHRVYKEIDLHLGKFEGSLGANSSGFSADVDCYFNDSVSHPDAYEAITVKGIMFKEGGYEGLPDCVILPQKK